MGEIVKHKPVLLVAAVTSRYSAALDWTIEKTRETWGELTLQSPVFDFTETGFYTESMGTDLKKQFIAFDRLIDPGDLPGIARVFIDRVTLKDKTVLPFIHLVT